MANWLIHYLKNLRKKTNAVRPVGQVCFGDFRRLTPISQHYGYDRGGPVDRYYIEKFLGRYSGDIKGRVLEVKDNEYTGRFGGEKVTNSDVLDYDAQNKKATIIADLTNADRIGPDTYDCVILTQVLQYIYDYQAAIRTVYRILKPGGKLLMTLPGITSTADRRVGATWYWTFHELAIRKVLEEHFRGGMVNIEVKGNVLVAAAFLYGMGSREITPEEYEVNDPNYQVILTVRAVK